MLLTDKIDIFATEFYEKVYSYAKNPKQRSTRAKASIETADLPARMSIIFCQIHSFKNVQI